MAVVADRQFIMNALLACGVDALLIFFVNTVMAFGAGGGNIITVNAGDRIIGRKLLMSRVAASARSRDHQPALQQPLAMNTFRIIIDHIMHCPLVTKGCLAFLLVTARAQGWNIGGIRGRLLVLLRKDRMRAVAIRTGRSVGIIVLMHLAMDAALVHLTLTIMATGTINFLGNGFTSAY